MSEKMNQATSEMQTLVGAWRAAARASVALK